MYYYLFYKFYRLFEAFRTTRWLTDVKAGGAVMALEILFLFSMNDYYEFMTGKHRRLEMNSKEILIPLSILGIIKWIFFVKDDIWKDYVDKFDAWPKEKNKKGFWVVVGVVVFVIANFIYGIYLNPPPGGLRL